jgi:hemerythrin-like domain-containing protein/rubredoxin
MEKSQGSIMPVGPLMKEHRLIERMIAVIKKEIENLASGKELDTLFIKETADFIKTYADQCHHGKEEDILFRELGKKDLSKEHSEIMNQLIDEHKYGRKTLKELLEAKDRYDKGDKNAKVDAVNRLKALVEFYPKHIEKEDKHFFLPCMDYFSSKEKEDMLEEFWVFDVAMIHKKYAHLVEKMESIKEEIEISKTGKYRCQVCGYIYSPEKGDPDNGIRPKTPFEGLSDDWVCPECGVGKERFEKMEEK